LKSFNQRTNSDFDAFLTVEENVGSKNQTMLNRTLDAIEKSLKYIDVSSDGISHLIKPKRRLAESDSIMDA